MTDEVSGYFAEILSKVTDTEADADGAAIKAMRINTRVAPEFVSLSLLNENDEEDCLCLVRAMEGRIQILVWQTGSTEPILVQDLGESGTMVPSVQGKSVYLGEPTTPFTEGEKS